MPMLQDMAKSIHERWVEDYKDEHMPIEDFLALGFKKFLRRTGLEQFLTALPVARGNPIRIPFEEYCQINNISDEDMEKGWAKYMEHP